MAKDVPTTLQLQAFLGNPKLWKFHQMTAAPPSVALKAPGAAIHPEQLRLTVSHGFRPDGWQFAAPPKAEKDPRWPTFSRYSPSSAVLPSEQAVDDALSEVRDAQLQVEAHAEEDAVWVSEQGPTRKFTIQKGTTSSWFVQAQSGPPPERPLPPIVGRIAAHVAAVYASQIPDPDHRPDPDPADTNPGWPTFMRRPHNPLGKLVSLALATGNWAATFELASTLNTRLGFPAEAVLGNGLSGRSGPVYKDLPLLAHQGGAWRPVGSWKGYAQRNRVVQMTPAVVNWELKPLFNWFHEARKLIPGLWHAGIADAVHIQGRRFTFESDISGFDTSVSRPLQTLLAWAVGRVRPDFRGVLNAWQKAESLPLITPHWNLIHGLCSIETFIGGTRSGVKTTAEAGTFYALVATLFALYLHGMDPFMWPYMPDASVLIQGDDVLVAADIQLDADTWADAHERLGLKAALVRGDLFLSKHMSLGIGAPVGGRIVQQTLSNEHEPLGDPTISQGLLALGFMARCERSALLPPKLRQLVGKQCRHAFWTRKYPILHHGPPDIAKMATDLSRDATARQDIHFSLEQSVGTEWLTQQWRDREHSPAAAAVVAWALARGLQPGRDAISLAQTTERLAKSIQAWPIPDRLAWATDAAKANLTSKRAADDVFSRLLTQQGIT